jgi:hypothetical protein
MSQKLRNKLQKPRSNKRRGNIFYNYSQRPQTYGIGSAVKLLQKDVVISASSGLNFQYSTKELDIVNMALQYKYVKILEVAVVQDQINLPNEQDKLYGIIDWGTNSEGYANLEESDNAKIFKNIGRNQFIFRPPRILTSCYVKTGSTTAETRQVFASGFNEIERLFGSSTNGYYFPFYYSFKNNTSVDRKLRIIVKLVFRGSKNTQDSEVARRINEVVSSERDIDELIAEKINELKQLKMKKGVEYAEIGTQTDDVPLINNQPSLDLSIQEDNKIYIKSEKQKKAEEREERLKKQKEEAEKRRQHKKEVEAKIVKDLAKAKVNAKLVHNRGNQECLLDYLLKNFKIKYKTVEELEEHADKHGCETIFPRDLRDPNVEEVVFNVLDDLAYKIFKPVRHRIKGQIDCDMDDFE